ncbi:MAG: DUF92 domain-containing protein [Alkalispirochaetaceae bacterium]
MPSISTLLLAILLNGIAAYGSYRKEAVTADGAAAGFLVGATVFVGAGVAGWFMLMWFFGSSSLIGRLSTETKERAVRMHEKGSRRDWVQVAANGGVAAVGAAAHAITGHPVAIVTVAASLAAATADTWASEIGSLSSHRPRSIVSFRPLPTGTSGGVTLLGTLASLGASLSIALIFLTASPGAPWGAATVVTAAGFLGSIVDSVLGATIQAEYENDEGERTEKRAGNRLIRGLPAVTNDAVNAVSGLLATAAAVALV